MTPAQLDMARKLVAHPKWRWVAGMLPKSRHGSGVHRVVRVDDRGRPYLNPDWAEEWMGAFDDSVPDISDYATAAILLRMAMEATEAAPHYGDPASACFRWTGGPDGQWSMPRPEELGTVAARALLECWGKA